MTQRERMGPVETGRPPHYSLSSKTNGLADIRRIDEMKKPASTNAQLQEKLDRCFGLFDDVSKYLTFKDLDDHYGSAVNSHAHHSIGHAHHSQHKKHKSTPVVSKHHTTSTHSSNKPTNSCNETSSTAVHKGSSMAAGNNKPVTAPSVVVSAPPTKKPGDKSRAWDLNTFLNILPSNCNDEPAVAGAGTSDPSTSSAAPDASHASPGKENQSRGHRNPAASNVKNHSLDSDKKIPSTSNVVKKSSTSSSHGKSRDVSSTESKDDGESATAAIFTDVQKVMAAVVSKKHCLSPLLSPIREFPSLQYKDGRPSLICRLPLTLLKNIPQPCSSDTAKDGARRSKVDRHYCDDVVAVDVVVKQEATTVAPSALKSSSSNSLVHSENSAFKSLTLKNREGSSAPGRPVAVVAPCEGRAPATMGCDLDDVPISERRRSTTCSKTTSTHGALDVKQNLKKPHQAPPFDDEVPPNLRAETTTSETSTATHKSEALSSATEICSLPSSFSNEATKPCAINELKVSAKRKSFDVEGTKSADESSSKKPKYDNSFLMAAAPEKPLPVDCNVKDSKFYMTKAKECKHLADGQASDKVLRLILYFESICYFFLTAYWMENTMSKESQIPYNMVKDTTDLLSTVRRKLPQLNELSERMQALFSHKLDILSLRMHSLFMCHICFMRRSAAYTNYRDITDYQRQATKERPSSVHGVGSSSCGAGGQPTVRPTTANGEAPSSAPASSGGAGSSQSAGSRDGPAPPPQSSTTSPTPSPASSTGSSSHSLPPGLVAIPQHVESMYRQQVQHLHNLFLAHDQWILADNKQKQHDYAFFNHLDAICRPMTLTSTVPSVCIYVLTALHWLKLLNDQQKMAAR